MRRVAILGMAGVLAAVGVVVLRHRGGALESSSILSSYDTAATYPKVEIRYPYDGAVFPPESVPPTFDWSSSVTNVDTWLVHVAFGAGEPLEALVAKTEWTPDEPAWAAFKARSSRAPARVTVLGVAADSPKTILASGAIALTTSADPVGAPVFYREVTLPFIEAVKDPARIRWRFGTIDSRTQPRVVLENLPVCGNCHSFSSDGRVLGMDVDYANDKGSYALTETAREVVLDKSKIITWSKFRERDKQPTFGLLSQVSPDGRYAVSTVKDRSVFVAKPDVAFSQLFFPLKGILALYDRQTGTFAALPGADDPAYVQSNPSFSPDGKYVVFARSKAHELATLKDPNKALLTPDECKEFLDGNRTFRFDLYRVPFNDGRGGVALPLKGASNNGQSNYFARYSPDGKWIAFCRANSFMLLQPDSELYVIPAEGGEARRLSCNRSRMNSWHSWSPNGKWLVFSSKSNTPYTQLFLAHMDEQGQSAPPIVLSQFTSPDRAANIPEFVNLAPDALRQIREDFVNDVSYTRTARDNLQTGDPKGAVAFYRKALALNPDNAEAHSILGGLLVELAQHDEGHEHLRRARQLAPTNSVVEYNWANALTIEKRYPEAVQSWKRAIELDPKNAEARTNLGAVLLDLGRLSEAEKALRGALAAAPRYAQAHHNLGNVLYGLGRRNDAARAWKEALRLNDSLFEAHQNLGVAMLEAHDLDGASQHLSAALRLRPNDVPCMIHLAVVAEKKGDLSRAALLMEQGRNVAKTTGQADLERECLRRLRQYRGK